MTRQARGVDASRDLRYPKWLWGGLVIIGDRVRGLPASRIELERWVEPLRDLAARSIRLVPFRTLDV